MVSADSPGTRPGPVAFIAAAVTRACFRCHMRELVGAIVPVFCATYCARNWSKARQPHHRLRFRLRRTGLFIDSPLHLLHGPVEFVIRHRVHDIIDRFVQIAVRIHALEKKLLFGGAGGQIGLQVLPGESR